MNRHGFEQPPSQTGVPNGLSAEPCSARPAHVDPQDVDEQIAVI